MFAKLAPVCLLLALAACGADGAPEAPSRNDVKPGVSISGDARIGVVTTL